MHEIEMIDRGTRHRTVPNEKGKKIQNSVIQVKNKNRMNERKEESGVQL